MSSSLTSRGRVRSGTFNQESNSHAISLIDTTITGATSDAVDGSNKSPTIAPTHITRTPSKLAIVGTLSKTEVKQELQRRKYAKWQDDHEESGLDPSKSKYAKNRTSTQTTPERRNISGQSLPQSPRYSNCGALDIPKQTVEEAVDVLYENQRGAFCCGLPLYSSNSLLNFDPAAWQTSSFSDSPVNIYTAQLPDPTWKWEWKTWYVDMSYDVDEQGWQYSLQFGSYFSWHGNHPWFHSFVRRRRWLRKRKRIEPLLQPMDGEMSPSKAGRILAADYFTIHSELSDRLQRLDSSRPLAERPVGTSAASLKSTEIQPSKKDLVIADIPTLLATLKNALVDRERLAAVDEFIQHGGDELFYLADAMTMIAHSLIHHYSHDQMRNILVDAISAADAEGAEKSTTSIKKKTVKRKAAQLEKALAAFDSVAPILETEQLDDPIEFRPKIHPNTNSRDIENDQDKIPKS